MDIMTGAGLVFGIVVIATMVFMGGDLHMFVSEHAVIIITAMTMMPAASPAPVIISMGDSNAYATGRPSWTAHGSF